MLNELTLEALIDYRDELRLDELHSYDLVKGNVPANYSEALDANPQMRSAFHFRQDEIDTEAEPMTLPPALGPNTRLYAEDEVEIALVPAWDEIELPTHKGDVHSWMRDQVDEFDTNRYVVDEFGMNPVETLSDLAHIEDDRRGDGSMLDPARGAGLDATDGMLDLWQTIRLVDELIGEFEIAANENAALEGKPDHTWAEPLIANVERPSTKPLRKAKPPVRIVTAHHQLNRAAKIAASAHYAPEPDLAGATYEASPSKPSYDRTPRGPRFTNPGAPFPRTYAQHRRTLRGAIPPYTEATRRQAAIRSCRVLTHSQQVRPHLASEWPGAVTDEATISRIELRIVERAIARKRERTERKGRAAQMRIDQFERKLLADEAARVTLDHEAQTAALLAQTERQLAKRTAERDHALAAWWQRWIEWMLAE